MPSVVEEDEDLEEKLIEIKTRVENTEERVDALEEQLGDNHVGAILDKLLSRIIEAEEERDRMKKVLDAVCDEVGVDQYEVLDEEGDE
jgi:predicted  nucleic acid-binding Zn-ribbon protein